MFILFFPLETTFLLQSSLEKKPLKQPWHFAQHFLSFMNSSPWVFQEVTGAAHKTANKMQIYGYTTHG